MIFACFGWILVHVNCRSSHFVFIYILHHFSPSFFFLETALVLKFILINHSCLLQSLPVNLWHTFLILIWWVVNHELHCILWMSLRFGHNYMCILLFFDYVPDAYMFTESRCLLSIISKEAAVSPQAWVLIAYKSSDCAEVYIIH